MNPYAAPTAAPMPTASNQNANFYIVLVVGLIMATVALYFVAPGLGILLTILLTPSLIRTAVVMGQRRQRGEDIRVGDRTILLLASLSAVVTALIAAAVAFFVACAALCFVAIGTDSLGSNQAFLFGTVYLISLAAFIATLWLLWKKRR